MKFLRSRSWLSRVCPVLLLLAVTGYASVHSANQLLSSNATISEAVHARYAARDLLFSMDDLETGMRGYVITGDDPYLEPFNTATAAVAGHFDEMERLLGNDAGQRQRIQELRPLIKAEVAASKDLVALRRTSGANAATLAIKSGDTKRTMDRIRQAVAGVLDAQEESLRQQGLQGEDATRQARNTLRTIVIGNTAATIVVLVAYYLVYRGNSRRRRVEDELIQSESRFRLLVDNAREYAIFLHDREGRIMTWNSGAERIIGYQADEIIGRHVSCFYPGGDADCEKVQAELRTALEKGQFEEDTWRVRKDQDRFWANVVITPLFDPRGVHVGFSRIIRDLSERKCAEEQLIASESSFRLLVENAKEYAMFLLDPEGRIKTWNAGAERIKGYRADEIIGRHLSYFYPGGDADREKVQAELKTALAEGRFEADDWRIRKDQTRFWASVLITPLFDPRGVHIGFSKITRDLTERKRAEEQLCASEANFRLLVDNCREYAIFLLDAEGRIKTWNAGAERIKGYRADEIIGRHISCVYPGGDGDWKKVQAELKAAMEKGQFDEDGWRVRKDQTRFWANDVVTPLFDPQGAHIGFSRITRDLTERKRAEDSIAELNRASQLRNMELEASNKELESFSYSVSHDLRSPLRSLDGFSQALLEDYGDKLDLEGQEHLRRIRAASQRMGQLIDDLLDLSRVTRVEMTREAVDMSKMAREVAEEVRGSEPAREVEFVIAGQLVANADAHLLRIVLTNLLKNAWKFTSKRSQARIEFGHSRENGTDSYFVRDNGAGFDMRYSNQLFGAFQRLHRATEFPGTGVGLATVQRIVRRCGGHVWAEGKLDAGATFYFTLQPPQLRNAA